jgi:hypothetical protein
MSCARRTAAANRIGKMELANNVEMEKESARSRRIKVSIQKRNKPAPKIGAPANTIAVEVTASFRFGMPVDFARAVSASRECISIRMKTRARIPPTRRWLLRRSIFENRSLIEVFAGLKRFVAIKRAKAMPQSRTSSIRRRTARNPIAVNAR